MLLRVTSRLIAICAVLMMLGTVQAQVQAPGAAAVTQMARTWSEADILDMFGPAAPRRQIQWGSLFRYSGSILTGAALVYAAFNWLYQHVQDSVGDDHLDAEFGNGLGVVVMTASTQQNNSTERTRGRYYARSGTSSQTIYDFAGDGIGDAQAAAVAFHGPSYYVLTGWFTPSNWDDYSACRNPNGWTVTACSVQYGYVPLAERMATGFEGRPTSRIRNAISDFVDNNPLSDTQPSLFPGMSWVGVGPNVNQWTDTLVNPGLDTDGDRYSDGWEVEAGTDPSDASSYPQGWPDVGPGRPAPEPAPPVDVGPAPQPNLPDAPVPTQPGEPPLPDRDPRDPLPDAPEPGPDPEDKPDPTEPGEDQEEDESSECWPLACEATLMALYNRTVEGNRITGDVLAQLDYQTDILLSEHRQLEFQSEVLLEQLRELEYEIVLAEELLGAVHAGNTIDENQYQELVYQRQLILSQLEQLEYQSSVIQDQFALQIFQAETQAALLVEEQLQTDILADVRELLRPDDDPTQYGAVSLVLPEWQPGALMTETWDAIGTQLETVLTQALDTGSSKFAFLASGWVPIISLGGGASCTGISMQILGSTQEVGVCDTPIHTVLATTARSALLALMLLGFWIGATKWVTQT